MVLLDITEYGHKEVLVCYQQESGESHSRASISSRIAIILPAEATTAHEKISVIRLVMKRELKFEHFS